MAYLETSIPNRAQFTVLTGSSRARLVCAPGQPHRTGHPCPCRLTRLGYRSAPAVGNGCRAFSPNAGSAHVLPCGQKQAICTPPRALTRSSEDTRAKPYARSGRTLLDIMIRQMGRESRYHLCVSQADR
ncbi:MAG: hypothetical protein AVDCRST_MAG77-3276 [uncultured Chloroflexi bacterium]|uniref:Uncharacterized protein n=1 Tax=uncultured Chloroflexota bacterium TaxID=166587 RepID=A0A6J4JCM6_9CHLR|nr:MAG: hypothetical protein AVDCRST_MAG77-3276 [uncultured Chloroflexota bacterium]